MHCRLKQLEIPNFRCLLVNASSLRSLLLKSLIKKLFSDQLVKLDEACDTEFGHVQTKSATKMRMLRWRITVKREKKESRDNTIEDKMRKNFMQ